MLQLQPSGFGPFVDAVGHGGVQCVVAAVQHFIAWPAFDPLVGVFAVELGQDALLCGELFVPLTFQLLAGVHIAGPTSPPPAPTAWLNALKFRPAAKPRKAHYSLDSSMP